MAVLYLGKMSNVKKLFMNQRIENTLIDLIDKFYCYGLLNNQQEDKNCTVG